jgi:hypothetical protein
MNCRELWDVLCSLYGVENVEDETNREELLSEAQRQVDMDFRDTSSNEHDVVEFWTKIHKANN